MLLIQVFVPLFITVLNPESSILGSLEDESKHVVHFSYPPGREFDVARWNPSNQNEVYAQ